jgi:hypothetical protein
MQDSHECRIAEPGPPRWRESDDCYRPIVRSDCDFSTLVLLPQPPYNPLKIETYLRS